ncbi:MAG: hypothetical protein GY869_17045, partial [Planctomycetes bacterium]|nr:hypothetical protein [Planctomycetota bacterium]
DLELEISEINNFLDGGGSLFLTGQNIAEDLSASGNLFLGERLHVDYGGPATAPIIEPVAGSPITANLGQGVILTGSDSNQQSMDLLDIAVEGLAQPAFNYYSSGYAMVTVEDSEANSKIVFAGFGFEGLRPNDPLPFTSPERLMRNILDWFGLPLAVEENEGAVNLVNGYRLYQNYPNPFNPITTIGYN